MTSGVNMRKCSKNQLEKGNNGLAKRKYITFGIEADDLRTAKMRLERVEADVLNNFKTLGVQAASLNGLERLELLHSQLHPSGQEKLKFAWSDLAKTGLSTKDFIAPTSFTFSKDGKTFRIGGVFRRCLLPADFGAGADGPDAGRVFGPGRCGDNQPAYPVYRPGPGDPHIKRKMSDLQKMKIEEQKKAVRAGYDMDIIPTDLATYGEEAQNLLQDLQSRNERMFLVTVLVQNIAPKRQKLFSDIMAASGIAQKYNCALKRLDYQQEQGLMSLSGAGAEPDRDPAGTHHQQHRYFRPLYHLRIVPGWAGIVLRSQRHFLKPDYGEPQAAEKPQRRSARLSGCFAGDTRILLADGSAASFEELLARGVEEIEVKTFDDETGQVITAMARDIRVEKYADVLKQITLEDGTTFRCTESHLIMDDAGEYMQAVDVKEGQKLSGGHTAVRVSVLKLPKKVPVYDLTVPRYMNFLLENGLVVHNSGKSFSAKREIVNVFLLTDDSIIIADPENEYGPLVKRFGKQGQVIDLSPTSSNYINPLDINLDYSDDENPITLKSDFVLSLCDLIIGGKDGLTPIEKTIIDRCTRLVYRDYLQDPRPENMPILGDLYELLRKQSEPEAQNIATALEIYVNGSLNVFNHRSNIDMDSHRVLCFQLKSLGKALKEIGLLIMQDAVWNRVTANREKHKTTWFYIDEFHLLLKGQTGAFSVEIWKRFRKWGGIPSGLTQNVKDLLASREIENIFENSDFIYMLNQAQGDRQILAKQLGISPTQLSYVTHSGPGEGLLFFGNVIIPFVDHFPKDTSLYQIMTTRPEEVAEAGT